jgi:hypothetical protein
MSGLLNTIRRLLSDAGEAAGTPSGVNVDLLPTYCPKGDDGVRDLSGQTCEKPRRTQ